MHLMMAALLQYVAQRPEVATLTQAPPSGAQASRSAFRWNIKAAHHAASLL